MRTLSITFAVITAAALMANISSVSAFSHDKLQKRIQELTQPPPTNSTPPAIKPAQSTAKPTPAAQPVHRSVNVKVTPIGSHDGEFCRRDRAMLFEDPDGTRLLFDPGFTVAGAKDPRLGKIDVVLLSSVHGDH